MLVEGYRETVFLDICLTASLQLGNFGNTLAKRIILLLEMFKNPHLHCKSAEKN